MDINASIIDQRVRGIAETHAAVLVGDPDRPITLHEKLEALVEDARSRVRDGHILLFV